MGGKPALTARIGHNRVLARTIGESDETGDQA
jgi:hypothetical protein